MELSKVVVSDDCFSVSRKHSFHLSLTCLSFFLRGHTSSNPCSHWHTTRSPYTRICKLCVHFVYSFHPATVLSCLILGICVIQVLNGQRKYQIRLKSSAGPIEVLLVNKDPSSASPVVLPVPPPDDVLQSLPTPTATPTSQAPTAASQVHTDISFLSTASSVLCTDLETVATSLTFFLIDLVVFEIVFRTAQSSLKKQFKLLFHHVKTFLFFFLSPFHPPGLQSSSSNKTWSCCNVSDSSQPDSLSYR